MAMDAREPFLFHFSAVKVFEDESVITTPLGQGIWRKDRAGKWEQINDGLASGTLINRLQVCGNCLYACTNEGLFRFCKERVCWQDTDLALMCYQIQQFGAVQWAATQYGLWTNAGGEWEAASHSQSVVYDFLYLPQFIVLALDYGVSVYDRYMGEWEEYALQTAVTSLAVYHGFLLGTTEKGELLVGNKRGSFEKVGFRHLFIFSVVAHGREVYACTDRGLYRFGIVKDRMVLRSMKTGFPVTDIDFDDKSVYMATLFQGIQTLARR
jgi:hypothetical protein